jgi:hypothetical protein
MHGHKDLASRKKQSKAICLQSVVEVMQTLPDLKKKQVKIPSQRQVSLSSLSELRRLIFPLLDDV